MRNKFVHQPPHFAECPRSSWNVEFVVHWVKLWQCEEGIAELPNTVVSSLLFCLDEFSHPCTEFQGDLIAGLMPPCALAGIPARLGQHKVQDDSGLCRLQLQGSYRCWGCHVAAGMEEAIFPQILIICPQNLLPESSFGCNYSNSSHCSVGAVFDNLQLGENLWIKEEVGHILACKTQNHHLKLGEVCGEAISWTGTAAVEKPEACMKCSGCLQVPILTFIWFSQFSSAGWKELMAVSCHHFFLSKSQFGNSSEIISCRWWGTLLPYCFSGTLPLGLCTK